MQKFRRLTALTLAALLALAGFASPALADTTTYWFTVWVYDAANQGSTGGSDYGAEKIIDNGATGTSSTGTWVSSSAPGFYGTDSLFSNAANSTYRWSYTPPVTAGYEVFVRWTAHPNRGPSVVYTVYNGSTSATVTVNQQVDGSTWRSLGKYTLASGSYVEVAGGASGGVNQAGADAVKFVRTFVDDSGTYRGPYVTQIVEIGPIADSTNCNLRRGGIADLFPQTDEGAHVSSCYTRVTTNAIYGQKYWTTVYTKHPVDHPNPSMAGAPRSFHVLGPFGSSSCDGGIPNGANTFNSTWATFVSCEAVTY